MNLSECIKVAFEGLSANKVRSGLTMLGIVIGVGAVIAMIAIGQGAKMQTLNAIQAMGTNVLIIRAGESRTGSVRGAAGSGYTLTYDDAVAIEKGCPLIVGVAPEIRQSAQAKYKNANTGTDVLGTTASYASVRNFHVVNGRWFTESEVRSMRRVAVIGPTVAENLFNLTQPVNKVIRVNGISIKVIGVTKAKGTGGFGDPDDQIFMPLTTAQKRVFGIDNIRGISAQAKTMELMPAATDQITALLRKRHKLGSASADDFSIRSQAEFMDTAAQTSQTFTMLLAGIAAVSLLVGGIGIMNIMLVSVTERTREIGIRKAVGAKSRDILLQFLIESVVLSALGGVIGVLFGIIAARILSQTAGWQVSISVPSVLLAFFFAAAVGIFFGIYPARKASALRPIDALRYE